MAAESHGAPLKCADMTQSGGGSGVPVAAARDQNSWSVGQQLCESKRGEEEETESTGEQLTGRSGTSYRRPRTSEFEFELRRIKMHEKLLLKGQQKLASQLLLGATPPGTSGSREPLAGRAAAIECRNLSYQVGLGPARRNILEALTLRVPEGAIYGLLGPSGCGKTTLLRLVAGRLKPTVGSLVRVFGFTPGEPASHIPGPVIGYMPQETSVYEEFTIHETLTYFGRINSMRAAVLSARIDFLVKFLELPSKGRLISTLSGGQKRRVSLAVALVHSPPLLILDEPTVGVDPLLRQLIWSYLTALAASERITVVITTHYIEEASQAHVVGLMRQGRLLAENEPHELMRLASAASLEEVFLKLCLSSFKCKQQTEELDKSGLQQSASSNELLKSLGQLELTPATPAQLVPITRGQKYLGNKSDGLSGWLKVLLAVTWKNFLRLRRNPAVLVFQFLLPALQVALFCLCIGGAPFDIPLAVVNEETGLQASGLFLNSLAATNTFILEPHENLSAALDSVRQGHAWAALQIPSGYTKHLNERLLHPAEASNETIFNSTLWIYPDLTNLHLSLAIEGAFKDAFVHFSRKSLTLLGYEPQLAELPVRMGTPVYGQLDHNHEQKQATGNSNLTGYLEFMAPGVVVSITYVMATGLTALAFILEKRDGLLERSQVSGVSTTQILLAHSLLQLIVMAFQIALVLWVTFYLFGVASRGPAALLATLVLLQGCTGMAFGLLISAVCREENAAIMMLVGTFYINLILAGIMWPIEAMPRWLRPLSYAQPQTLPIVGLRDLMARGWSLDEPSVQLAFLVTLAWFLVFLLGAGLCMRHIN